MGENYASKKWQGKKGITRRDTAREGVASLQSPVLIRETRMRGRGRGQSQLFGLGGIQANQKYPKNLESHLNQGKSPRAREPHSSCSGVSEKNSENSGGSPKNKGKKLERKVNLLQPGEGGGLRE